MAAETHTAFFSYSRTDSDFAKRLAADLKAAGASVWMDQLDITPGARWDDAVSEALHNSPRFLVVLSPASTQSENVSDEVGFALSNQKHVVPVLYRECEVPFRLARFEYIDFRGDYEAALQQLVAALAQPHVPAVATPPPAEPQPAPSHPAAAALPGKSSSGAGNKLFLIGVLAVLVAVVAGYFVTRPSGLDVTILAPNGFHAPGFTIDGKNFPINGQAVHLKLAPGNHEFAFPKAGCSGSFTVAPGKTTFVPSGHSSTDCSLKPMGE